MKRKVGGGWPVVGSEGAAGGVVVSGVGWRLNGGVVRIDGTGGYT